MLEHIPLGLALAVGGIILMVIVVLIVAEALDRRRARSGDSPQEGNGS